jgi:translation initiation factor IF-3
MKIVLLFRATNWLSTVKKSKMTIIFRGKSIILETAMVEMTHIVFVSMVDISTVVFFLNFGKSNLFLERIKTKLKTY